MEEAQHRLVFLYEMQSSSADHVPRGLDVLTAYSPYKNSGYALLYGSLLHW